MHYMNRGHSGLICSIMHFHSPLSNSAFQNAATTYYDMNVLVEHLIENRNLVDDNCPYGNTDGSRTQYQCTNALYFHSLLSFHYSIIIDRAAGAPGHGKASVNGLNVVDKQYFKIITQSTKTAQEDDDPKI